MAKLAHTFLRVPLHIVFRGFHGSAKNLARGSRTPRFPIEFVENMKQKQFAAAPVSAPIDESEGPVIELSKEEIIQEIELKKEHRARLEEANEGLPPFQRLMDSDRTFVLAMQRTMKKNANRLISVEGRRLIEDAIHAGIKCESIFFSKKDTIRGIQLPVDSVTKFFKVPYTDLKLWSTLTTCPGITGVFQYPKQQELETLKTAKNLDDSILPINIVCDQVRDPGNMGAILRIAAAAGCNQVITTKGCVNIWDSKVVRASMGSIFRVPVVNQSSWDHLEKLASSESATVFLADNRDYNDQELKDYTAVSFCTGNNPLVLIVGGETLGISNRASSIKSSTKINIPLARGVESLNVGAAVAVLMFEIRRQFMLNAT